MGDEFVYGLIVGQIPLTWQCPAEAIMGDWLGVILR